jgi:metal-sulfur cluster biosynthetic enzyme
MATQGHSSRPSLPDQEAIRERLGAVLDPELDESILQLGFVESLHTEGDHVTVEVRLPTFWCAPNFAYMMAEDIRSQVLAVETVRDVTVRLKDHCAGPSIEAAVNAGKSFPEAFPDEAFGNLDELRDFFLRKGFMKRQEQLLRSLKEAGLSLEQIGALRVGDVSMDGESCQVRRPKGPAAYIRSGKAARRYLARRAQLSLDCSPTAPLITDLEGTPVAKNELEKHFQAARTIRLSLDANASLCCALLAARKSPTSGTS